MQQWANYFIATGTAAATLTGLIFLGVSLSLTRILEMNHLPGRALGSVVLLTNILIISSFCLIPGQPVFWLGCEISIIGVVLWVFLTRLAIKMHRNSLVEYRKYYVQNQLFTQAAIIPYLVAGVFLILKLNAGFYWLVPGITFSFIKALVDSWVLLVEINR